MIRRSYEQKEVILLSPLAMKSIESKGRKYSEAPCEIRTCFQRDRDRILHSKSFRRLKHKTQVFLSPEGDHYRTRLTHTLEVSQIARTIARALELNEDLVEAIALGHDLGHTPFGHCGEEALNCIHEGGFRHNEQSLRVVTYLETRKNTYPGLNLSYEVNDGILNHTGTRLPKTLEGQVVKLSDRIAYINHDIDDAVRGKVLSPEDLPTQFKALWGEDYKMWLNKIIMDVIFQSEGQEKIQMSPSYQSAFDDIRAFMFAEVYLNEKAKEEEGKAREVLFSLYKYFQKHPKAMPASYYTLYLKDHLDAIKDYVASMSDRYAVHLFKEIYEPKFWLY